MEMAMAFPSSSAVTSRGWRPCTPPLPAAGLLGRESNSEPTSVSRGHGLSVASGPLWPLWTIFCSAWQRANGTPRLCLRLSAWTTTACIPQLQSHMRCYAKTPRVGLAYSLELTGDCIDYQQAILLFPSIPQDHTAPRPPPTALPSANRAHRQSAHSPN